MLKAVLFDMDDTLLDINLNAFLYKLCRNESQLLSEISRKNSFAVLAHYTASLLATAEGKRTDTMLNQDFFIQDFKKRTGIPLDDPIIAEPILYYEKNILPQAHIAPINAKPRPGVFEALDTVLSHGYRIALFTNPVFNKTVCRVRMKWAGIEDYPFERITVRENSTRCKPNKKYYSENLTAMGLKPEEVLMVGNDPKRDFMEPESNLQTAYVGIGEDSRATWCGDMCSFAKEFNQIVDLFEKKG